MAITRKDFLKGTLATAAVGVIVGCGDDETVVPGTTTSTTSSGTTSSTSSGGGSTPDPTTTTTTTGGGGGASGDGGSGGSGSCANGASASEYDGPQHHPNNGNWSITAQEVENESGGPYVMPGNHTHSVTLTAFNWNELKTTGTTVVTSGAKNSHTHDVTITCD